MNISLKGTVYAAGAALNLSGGTNNTFGSHLITKTMSISGGTYFEIKTKTDAAAGFVTAGGSSGAGMSLVE